MWWWWWLWWWSMMNCFCGIVDRRKAFSLISSRDHCQRSSPSRISDMPRVGFESAQNLSSGFVEWSCAVVITTTPRRCRVRINKKARQPYSVFIFFQFAAQKCSKKGKRILFEKEILRYVLDNRRFTDIKVSESVRTDSYELTELIHTISLIRRVLCFYTQANEYDLKIILVVRFSSWFLYIGIELIVWIILMFISSNKK